MKRVDGRSPAELRPVIIRPHFVEKPAGSVLIEMGQTRVVCAASVEDAVPRWMKEQKVPGGWITAEYSMLPFSTSPRKSREVNRGHPEGRTQEIQRLIGRAMRSVVDLEQLGTCTVWLDCDVLQADGGTRTAAITGSYVALALALRKIERESALKQSVAAVSVGIFEGTPLLDLCYVEDSKAEVDMNVVMTGDGRFVEVQGTGEEATFSQKDLSKLLKLAGAGIRELAELQTAALAKK
jgi:ribonuclease PH